MTTAAKLRFGFGVLLALLVLSSLVTIFRFQGLQRNEGAAATNARLRRDAVTALENGVLHYALAVRSFVQTREPGYQQTADRHARAVDQYIREYKMSARTPAQQGYASRMELWWSAAQQRANALYAEPGTRTDDSLGLSHERAVVEDFLEEVQADALTMFETRRREYFDEFENVFISGIGFMLAAMLVAVIISISVSRGIVRGERAIQREREKLRVTLSSIGDAVITADVNGRVAYMNPVAEMLTGWTSAEASGRTLSDVYRIVVEDTGQPAEGPITRAVRGSDSAISQALLLTNDGGKRLVEDSVSAMRDDAGTMTGVAVVFRDIAARKQAESAEAHLAAIVTSSHDAIVSKDLNSIIKSWNTGAEELFGYTAEEMIGKSITLLIPPHHLDEEPFILDRIVRGERIDNYETIRRRKDGSLIHVSLTVSPVRDSSGRIIGASKNARDITEQKRTAQALAESHARFATLFNASPVGVYVVDSNLRIKLMSPMAAANFGPVQNLIGSDLADVVPNVVPPDIASEVVERFRHTLATGEPYVSPEFYARGTGQQDHEYYDWQIHRITLPDGTYGVVCYYFDITSLVVAKQAAHESAVRYLRLFESSYDGILIVDANTGKIIDANAVIAALLGREQSELVGRTISDIGLAGKNDESSASFRQLQQAGHLRKETSVRNTRGEQIAVELVASVYHEGDRLVAQYNVRDIRERHALERKITQQAEMLAGESRRKDEFLAMLSHELRNPLAPIRSAVYLLNMQAKDGENAVQRQAIDIIDRQVNNLTKLVGDLLDVSRVISGRIQLNRQPLDAKQVLHHAVQATAPAARERRHEVVQQFDDVPVWIHGDATRIEEILVNLLSNALKYTDDGGHIEIACACSADGWVEFRVRDNGIGIEPELLPRIFDLFTQSDRSLARSQGGLGIGLSLVHRLVALHGGTVDAYSPPPGRSRGSEFVLRLPGIVAEPTCLPVEPTPADTSVPEGRRVLVVDDNVDQVTMLVTTLRSKGYAVQSAHTGPDGLKVALQWSPDVVLLDIGLPGLNGYEVARQVRSSARAGTSKIKLIALTGYGRDTDVTLAREAGFDIHLTKPCDFEKLDKLLAE